MEECPLCCEKMDTTDKDLRPCPCGFQVCVFCYWKVRQQYNNSCPGCRRQYGDEEEPAPQPADKQAVAAEAAAAAAAAATSTLPKPHQYDAPNAVPSSSRGPQSTRRYLDPPATPQPSHAPPPPSTPATPGLPPAASWASPDPLSHTPSADLDHLPTPHPHHAPPTPSEDAWPALADSMALPVPKPAPPAPSSHPTPALQPQHSAPFTIEAEPSGSFKSTAQVTSVVSGIRRAVCVPLSLASRAVAPYPDAVELLYAVRQAIQQGNINSRDGAAQLVNLLREREGSAGLGPTYPAGDTAAAPTQHSLHTGYGADANGGAAPSSSSPYSHFQQGAYGSTSHHHQQQQSHHQQYHQQYNQQHNQQHNQHNQHQQSVWNDHSGLPGVSFNMPTSSSAVPQHVQALWHEPTGGAGGAGGYGSGALGSSWGGLGGYGQNGVVGGAGAGARYAPPGMHSNQAGAYKPLSLAN